MIRRPSTLPRLVARRSVASSLTAGLIVAALAFAPASVANAEEAATSDAAVSESAAVAPTATPDPEVPATEVSAPVAPVAPEEEAPPAAAPGDGEASSDAPAGESDGDVPAEDSGDATNDSEVSAPAAEATARPSNGRVAALVAVGVPTVTVAPYIPGNGFYENAATVTWTEVAGATSYIVRIAYPHGRVSDTTVAADYRRLSLWLSASGSVEVSVAALVAGAQGNFSPPVEYTPVLTNPILPPTNVGVTEGSNSFTITYTASQFSSTYYYAALRNASTGVWGYDIYLGALGPGQNGSATIVAQAGVSYDVFVWASNGFKASEPVIVTDRMAGTLPTAPAELNVSSGDGYAALTWPASEAGSSPVIRYDVQYSSNGTDFTDAAPATTTAAVVTGLDNGTPYTVRVRAVTEVGASDWIESASFTPAGVPFAPGSLAVTPASNELNVSWNAAAGNGAAVTSYEVQWHPVGDTEFHSLFVTATSASVVAQNGISYDVRVRALNAVGSGAWSTVESVAVIVAPDAPDNLWSTGADTSMTVGWDAPSDTGGSAILDYEVSWIRAELLTQEGVTEDQIGTMVTTGTQVTIPGLINVKEYLAVVRARSSAGWGAYSSIVRATPFTFEPTFTALDGTPLAGDTLKPGDIVVMSGVEGLPGEKVGFEMHSKTMVLGTATVAADGTYRIQARIPKNAPAGSHKLYGWIGIPKSIINASVGITIAAPVVPAATGDLAVTGVDETFVDVSVWSALALMVTGALMVSGALMVVRARRRASRRMVGVVA
ncbi:MAG: fibronectin type III domain-containing protein [Microbacteriaceae bacterium]